MTLDNNEAEGVTSEALSSGLIPENTTAQQLVAQGAVIVPAPPRIAGDGAGRKREWRAVPEAEKFGYDGWLIFMWTNFSGKLANEISGGDVETARAALGQIFIRHNEWRDKDTGELYPQPDVDLAGFWDAIPQEIAIALVTMINLESTQLSFLINKRRANSNRR